MKLCISSTGPTLAARADATFGRAPYLLVVDSENLAFEVVENSGAAATQGAGISAASLVAKHGAQALLTGRVGPNALEALTRAGIEIHEGLDSADTVAQAVEKFRSGAYAQVKKRAEAASGPACGRGMGQGRCGGGMGRGRGGGMGGCRKR